MIKNHEQALVDELLQQVYGLLEAPNNFVDTQPYITALVDIYAQLTGIDASDSLSESAHCNTETGVAISPVQAAICLKEPLRTQIFIQGIKQAIEDVAVNKSSNNSDQISGRKSQAITILYAGTGPYGILLLPLLALLKPLSLQVCLIDIHQTNVDSINHLVRLLGISESVISVETMDACHWQPNSISAFDLVISETMTHLLQREPQVFVFSHLEQFLKPSGWLIPQRISLTASLEGEGDTMPLGEFFCLDRQSAKDLRLGNKERYQGQLQVLNHNDAPTNLKLDTHITVYEEYCLSEHQSSLSIPVRIENLHFGQRQHIPFHYEFSDEPCFVFDVPRYQPDPTLCHSTDVGDSGLMHLKRFWHKVQLDKVSALDPQVRDHELGLDTRLAQECGASLHVWLAAAFQQHPPNFAQFECWLVEEHDLTSQCIKRINDKIFDTMLQVTGNR